MKEKTFFSRVESEHEFDDLPATAVIKVSSAFAIEILNLASLVKANGLYSAEKFNYSTLWYDNYYDEIDDIEPNAKKGSTECDCLVVSGDEFWFTSFLKHSNVSISTDKFALSQLTELVIDAQEELSRPYRWKEQGDPNFHVILKDGNWFAQVQMNGQMSQDQQAAWMDCVIGLFDAPTATSTPQVPRVLVTVSGGVADYVCDSGVNVEVFDHDNYDDDKVGTSKAPRHFSDLARPVDVPFKSRFEEMASAAGISMNFDDDIGKYRWESEKEGVAQPGWDAELEAWQDACVANGLIKKVKDQYAESIIGDDSSRFDAIEIHGVTHVESELNGGDPVCEINDEEPEFYSVYLHLKEGGVVCVGDFSLLPEAIAYASALSIQYGWECSSCLIF